MYYADIDEKGSIAGFYIESLHGTDIPGTAVPITPEQWQEYSAAAHLYKFDDGAFRQKTEREIADEIAARPPVPKTPEQERLDLMQSALDDLILNVGGGL